MRLFLFFIFLNTALMTSANEKLVVWPEPGSVFPVKQNVLPGPVQKRVDSEYWVNPPRIISPFDKSWFDYQTIIWGNDNRIKNDIYYAMLKDIYIRSGMVYSNNDPKDFKLNQIPFYNTNLVNILYIRNKGASEIHNEYKKTRDKKFLIRSTKDKNATLESKPVDEEANQICKSIASRLVELLPLSYDLRDEGTYVHSAACPKDFDFSPESLSYFRIWLKQKYTSLELLNSQWGTDFKTWDQVEPFTTDEMQEREFKKSVSTSFGTEFKNFNLAPWADHREYNDDTFHAALARYTQTIHSIDPGAPVGYSGTQMPSAYGGFDFWKISKNVSWLEYYDVNGSREIIRSFMPKNYPKIGAISLKSKIESVVPRVWKQILHGDAGVLVWPYGKTTGVTLMFEKSEQDFTFNQIGQDLGVLFKELRNGISSQIRRSDLICNEIAFYYSHASIRSDWMLEVKRDGKSWVNRNSSWESSHNFNANGREGYYKLIEDLGYQFTHISSAQVEQNLISELGIKLIIMPRTITLSMLEIENLKKFVENGGLIISDIHAGRLNEHCKLYEGNSPFDEVLGVERDKFIFQEDKKGEENFGYTGGFGQEFKILLNEDFGLISKNESFVVKGFVEPGVKSKTAKSYGKTDLCSVLFQNKLGKGLAFTLNFDLANYLQERNSNLVEVQNNLVKQRQIFQHILNLAKIEKFCSIANSSGVYPAGIETFVYKQESSYLLALHINAAISIDWESLDDVAEEAKFNEVFKLNVKLPKSFIVTELLSGASVDLKENKFSVELSNKRPLIFSLMPYTVETILVESDDQTKEGFLNTSIKIKSSANQLEDHVVNVELQDLNGKSIPTFLVNVPLSKGNYQGKFDFKSVAPGKYNLVFKDVLSGKRTIKSIEIK